KAGDAGDAKKAAALTRSLLPDEAALKQALRDDAPADFVKQLVDAAAKLSADDAQAAAVFKREPARSQVNAYAATTEEIKAYVPDSVPFKSFPGGTKRLAEKVLRPGVTFYEVEFVEPGKTDGLKFHMFYWDGAHWRMLGPAWRTLPR